MTDEAARPHPSESFEWRDASPQPWDCGERTLLPLSELSRRVDIPADELGRLLEQGEIEGVWTGDQWLVTAAAYADHATAGWSGGLELRVKPFRPRPRHSPAGDCLFFYFREDESWADRVDELLTVYRAFATDRVVGFKLKNVSLLKEQLGTFLVEFETKEVSIYLLFTRMLQWKLQEVRSPDSTAELVRKYAEAIEAAGPTTARLPVLT